VFTILRLKKQGITCISPKRINIAGDVSTMVFDKTGTLTEESVSIHGFRSVQLEKGNLESCDKGEMNFVKYQPDINELVPVSKVTKEEDWWTTNIFDAERLRN